MPPRLSTLRMRFHPVAPVVIGVGLSVLLVWSRSVGIGQSLWHDEIYSVVHYTSGPLAPFTEPYVPNNHVLFNVLTAATTVVLGQTEATVRLWSVLPGIASVLLLGAWMIRRGAVWTGLATAGFLTVSPVHLGLSRQARGYGLAFLAMSGMIVFGVRAVERGTTRDLVLVALFGTVGVLTLPVFVLPFVGAIAAMSLVGLDLRRAALVVTSVAVASLAWYLPMLSDLFASTSQEFGRQLGVSDLVVDPVRLIEPTFRLVAGHVPMPLWIALSLLLAVLAAVELRTWTSSGRAALLIGLVLLGPYVVLLLTRVHIEDRFASYQLIPLAIVVVLGATRLLTAGPEYRRILAAGTLMVASLLAGASFVRHATLVGSRPVEAFQDVGRLTNEMNGVPVVTNSVRPLGLEYYIERSVHTLASEDVNDYLCHQESPFIFIDHPHLIGPADTGCLLDRGASLVSFEQRARGEHIDVWIVLSEGE